MNTKEMLDGCVASVFDVHDEGKKDKLDKADVERWIREILREAGEEQHFNDDDFQKTFNEFDENKDGTVSREEMHNFIVRIAGIKY